MITERYAGPADAADAYWMERALHQARLGEGATSPNPPVGAVIVQGDRLVAKGHHAQAGGPHAEVAALQSLEDARIAKGATLYVTLEPCSTQGRTPPCVDAIIAAGLDRVVYGSADPNPAHTARARRLLEARDIGVTAGVLQDRCDHLIRIFRHWIRHHRPYLIAKAGLSLDGRLSRPPGESSWLTSPAARQDAQRLRRQADAILAGAETIRKDDPALTCRDPQAPPQKAPLRRIVLTRTGNVPASAKVFTDAWARHTVVLQRVSWPEIAETLAGRGITSVLIEGGGRVLTQALDAGAVHEIWLYLAPCLCGGPDPLWAAPELKSWPLSGVTWTALGDDLRMTAFPVGQPVPLP